MPLIEVAKAILVAMRRKHGQDPEGDLGSPEGSLISSSWLDLRFSHDGRRYRISMPTIILRDAGRNFQLGYVYSSLAQRIRPRVEKCPDCGKLVEPLYGFSNGEIYQVDGDPEGGAC